MRKLLIANRGEVAVRVQRAAADAGLATVAVFSRDDAGALHARLAGEAVALDASGPAAYLDAAALIAAARRHGCDALHPGWGYLAENAGFAEACGRAGLVFVGPPPAQLALFGDKARARTLAAAQGLPLLPGTGAATLAELREAWGHWRATHPGCALMLKAVAGGGGRGMRWVAAPDELAAADEACRREARAAFGDEALYGELGLPRARHLEVQLIGDGREVMALGERECTLQRRFQKLVEFAPAPRLAAALREALADAALKLGRAAALQGLATVEFLVDAAGGAGAAGADGGTPPFVFIEVNPRLQVEHTVTEAVTGLDLVRLQLALADGQPLGALGLDVAAPPPPRGQAVQWRLCAETLGADGQPRPAGGTLGALHWPGGPGVRVDHHALSGHAPSPLHDTLLAKLVVHDPGTRLDDLLRRSQRALAECRIDGLATNLPLLRALAADEALRTQALHTRWLADAWPRLAAAIARQPDEAAVATALPAPPAPPPGSPAASAATVAPLADGEVALVAPMAGRLVAIAAAGTPIEAGQDAAVVESMKMEHGLPAPAACEVVAVEVEAGAAVAEGQRLLVLRPLAAAATAPPAGGSAGGPAVSGPRADLQALHARRALTLDAARPQAVARRHAAGGRTARENLADLCDEGSFIEYGAFAIAAQTRRRPLDELVRQTPADGLVSGLATVNAAQFGPERARCAVLAYDYTVLAGTQGLRNHAKTDRLLEIARRERLPVVLFAEGGGGRPGDVDAAVVAGLDVPTFGRFAALSGVVPVVGVVHGRCFAGNAALLGCCDVIIATRAANLGMGGPAMIEGGGLGVFRPEQIGPAEEQHRVGVVDLLVDDEAAATAAARRYLAYFQGPQPPRPGDDEALRHAVPPQRQRAYDMRALLRALADEGSLMELRAGFAPGMVTALARLEGRPVGLLANDGRHLGGAIDADGADKAARFLQLCNAHGLPLVSLCDTPGFMVGPEIERRAQVRHAARLFVTAAKLTVPCFTVVVRRGYGLGAMAMAAGGFHAPLFTVAWPTAEFGAMGLEGAVRLGFRRELEAAAAGPEREALFQRLLAEQVANGSAIQMATLLEIDAVIDPAETRAWLRRGLASASPVREAAHRFVDTW